MKFSARFLSALLLVTFTAAMPQMLPVTDDPAHDSTAHSLEPSPLSVVPSFDNDTGTDVHPHKNGTGDAPDLHHGIPQQELAPSDLPTESDVVHQVDPSETPIVANDTNGHPNEAYLQSESTPTLSLTHSDGDLAETLPSETLPAANLTASLLPHESGTATTPGDSEHLPPIADSRSGNQTDSPDNTDDHKGDEEVNRDFIDRLLDCRKDKRLDDPDFLNRLTNAKEKGKFDPQAADPLANKTTATDEEQLLKHPLESNLPTNISAANATDKQKQRMCDLNDFDLSKLNEPTLKALMKELIDRNITKPKVVKRILRVAKMKGVPEEDVQKAAKEAAQEAVNEDPRKAEAAAAVSSSVASAAKQTKKERQTSKKSKKTKKGCRKYKQDGYEIEECFDETTTESSSSNENAASSAGSSSGSSATAAKSAHHNGAHKPSGATPGNPAHSPTKSGIPPKPNQSSGLTSPIGSEMPGKGSERPGSGASPIDGSSRTPGSGSGPALNSTRTPGSGPIVPGPTVNSTKPPFPGADTLPGDGVVGGDSLPLPDGTSYTPTTSEIPSLIPEPPSDSVLPVDHLSETHPVPDNDVDGHIPDVSTSPALPVMVDPSPTESLTHEGPEETLLLNPEIHLPGTVTDIPPAAPDTHERPAPDVTDKHAAHLQESPEPAEATETSLASDSN
jgi:hypothetical protein